MDGLAIFTWILAFISILGAWSVGSGHRSGWLWAFLTQVFWAYYFFSTEQWSLLFQAGIFGILFLRNYKRMDVYTKQHVRKKEQ